ncbi:hypothetical protein SAMN02910289_01824 [Lachnospiraceae bacterium RM5]|nr:hypothetical protein SAMN02910289_01824 [Lachnospiraceae bacterium RM5]
MNKEVTLRELVGARIVIAICIAVYYWCWARNDWHNYYQVITSGFAIFAFTFFLLLGARERKYKKESFDERAVGILRKCDSVCYRISLVAITVIGFLCAMLRVSFSTEVIGYMLVGLIVFLSIIRTIMFSVMDTKGV